MELVSEAIGFAVKAHDEMRRKKSEAPCQSVAEKETIIGYTRMLRCAARRFNEADSPAKIARCKDMPAELLGRVDSLVF